MISDREIWRSAHTMVNRYGDDAANQAAARANKMAAEGDDDGCGAWIRITRAIVKLQATTTPKGETMH